MWWMDAEPKRIRPIRRRSRLEDKGLPRRFVPLGSAFELNDRPQIGNELLCDGERPAKSIVSASEVHRNEDTMQNVDVSSLRKV
jgi:hypothetical protein